MRQRDIIINRIEMLEARFKTLEFIVRRGSPVEEFYSTLNQSTEILSNIKDMIEREEHSPSEINKQ
jgi:hypothetical protein